MGHPVSHHPFRFASHRTTALVATLLVVVFIIQILPGMVRSQEAASFKLPDTFPSYGVRLGEPARDQEDEHFDALVDRFVYEYFRFYPTRATNAGIHDFDSRLRPTSETELREFLSFIKGSTRMLQLARAEELTPERRFDHTMLQSRLRGMALQMETVAPWQRNPSYYVGLVSSSIHSLLKRDFAPLEVRVASLNGRLAEVPRVFADARTNLTNPPPIYVEVAQAQARGLKRFLSEVVPPQVEAVGNNSLVAQFNERNATAIEAVGEYITWLETDLLPRADGDFALGENVYSKKLLYEEMADTPLDELLARAERALAEAQAQMQQAASEIESGLTPREALVLLAKEAPDADHLVPMTQDGLAKIREFVVGKEILTVPEKENLRVAETPIYRRALSFASLDSPGVFEENADEAYYYVTPPDPAWPAEKQRDHLSQFNPYRLEIISIHEAYPGHYYQFLALRDCGSTVRALFGSRSNSEGWAHYCEQMMLEEGFGEGDPRYRLSQLDAALKRICRYIVGISLHTKGMTYEEAVAFFEEEGYLPRVNAEREARRGTSDPTYLVYTLGKRSILDLREDYRQALGSEFRLGEFHDRFLSYGRAPIPLIRQAMLAGAN
jgi:uncharacterized protein (DUF885 family)